MSAVESWFAPAAVAEPLPRRQTQRRAAAAKPKPRRVQRRGFRVRLPLLWMAAFAILLVGVVAVNVAVLRANVSVNDLDTKIEQAQEENAMLRSQNARLRAAPLVERAAADAKLILAPDSATGYLDMVDRK